MTMLSSQLKHAIDNLCVQNLMVLILSPEQNILTCFNCCSCLVALYSFLCMGLLFEFWNFRRCYMKDRNGEPGGGGE
jgi:hypothetical protein